MSEPLKHISIPQQQSGKLFPTDSVGAVVKAIIDNFSPKKIIIFGSYAAKKQTPESDLDLLIIMDTELPPHKRSVPVRLLFKPMPCVMDLLIYTPSEINYWNGTANHIITHALRTGKVLYAQPTH